MVVVVLDDLERPPPVEHVAPDDLDAADAFDAEQLAQASADELAGKGGTINAVAHDRRSAALCGTQNTGHAAMQPDARGPNPGSLVVATGNSSVDEMVANTERGLLITKLHYTNVVNQQEVSITGMTRAGTFMIENGKITHPVKNMRFTQSLLTAFNNIAEIGKEAHAGGGALFGGNFVVPAMKINNWRFSSPTGF